MNRIAGLVALALAACAQGPVQPASLDTRSETCAFCRMAVSDARFAAQLVAPAEEPRFFDDIGCLRDYLKAATQRPAGAVAYVADHRTKSWVRAGQALYTKSSSLETPMGSYLIAHADAVSRGADSSAGGGTSLAAADVFGPEGPPRRTQ